MFLIITVPIFIVLPKIFRPIITGWNFFIGKWGIRAIWRWCTYAFIPGRTSHIWQKLLIKFILSISTILKTARGSIIAIMIKIRYVNVRSMITPVPIISVKWFVRFRCFFTLYCTSVLCYFLNFACFSTSIVVLVVSKNTNLSISLLLRLRSEFLQ